MDDRYVSVLLEAPGCQDVRHKTSQSLLPPEATTDRLLQQAGSVAGKRPSEIITPRRSTEALVQGLPRTGASFRASLRQVRPSGPPSDRCVLQGLPQAGASFRASLRCVLQGLPQTGASFRASLRQIRYNDCVYVLHDSCLCVLCTYTPPVSLKQYVSTICNHPSIVDVVIISLLFLRASQRRVIMKTPMTSSIILALVVMANNTSPITIDNSTNASQENTNNDNLMKNLAVDNLKDLMKNAASHTLRDLMKSLAGLGNNQTTTFLQQLFSGSDIRKTKEGLKKSVGDSKVEAGSWESSASLLTRFLQQLMEAKELSTMIVDGLGVNDDFVKPLSRIVKAMSKLIAKQSSESKNFGLFSSAMPRTDKSSIIQNTIEDYSNDGSPPVVSQAVPSDINGEFLQLAKNIFEDEFGSLDSIVHSIAPDSSGILANFSANNTSFWMMMKSTWERVLAYVEEENSLSYFMQLTPVKIIDRIMSLGNDMNLINFLAKKLDPEFGLFLVTEIDPYLGPLRDFESFYNFTKDYGLNGVLDYFRSEKFTFTANTMYRLFQAYLENKISSDLVNQYIELISFNNVELYNFYKSVIQRQNESSSEAESSDTQQRFKRNVLDHIVSSFKFGGLVPEDSLPQSDEPPSETFIRKDYETEETSDYDAGDKSEVLWETLARDYRTEETHDSNPEEKSETKTVSRNGYSYPTSSYRSSGGYGGGGMMYGGSSAGYMSTLDPYVVLGALSLGILLGFLLYRLVNGTRRGRSDIGDGSLSLWLSDIPNQVLPWGTSIERVRREAQNFNKTGEEEFSLPESLRGDVWSTDPLVGHDFLEEDLAEDDIADHLNQLWRVFQETSSPACVHSHLCMKVTNSTTDHLTGRDSSMALLMATVSNMMGVVRSGQLVDHVTNNLVLGNHYICPNPTSCHQYLL
nr:uncharacterized protein LOC128697968 [Cherax quadricarinatus]